jgi:hypothetical protein
MWVFIVSETWWNAAPEFAVLWACTKAALILLAALPFLVGTRALQKERAGAFEAGYAHVHYLFARGWGFVVRESAGGIIDADNSCLKVTALGLAAGCAIAFWYPGLAVTWASRICELAVAATSAIVPPEEYLQLMTLPRSFTEMGPAEYAHAVGVIAFVVPAEAMVPPFGIRISEALVLSQEYEWCNWRKTVHTTTENGVVVARWDTWSKEWIGVGYTYAGEDGHENPPLSTQFPEAYAYDGIANFTANVAATGGDAPFAISKDLLSELRTTHRVPPDAEVNAFQASKTLLARVHGFNYVGDGWYIRPVGGMSAASRAFQRYFDTLLNLVHVGTGHLLAGEALGQYFTECQPGDARTRFLVDDHAKFGKAGDNATLSVVAPFDVSAVNGANCHGFRSRQVQRAHRTTVRH